MDGTSYFPSRPEMEANLATFAERAALEVRYDCAWTATRLLDGPEGADRFEVETADGRYTLRHARSWRSASPSRTPRPGSGWSTPTTTPTSARPRPMPAGACCIIGKQNSGLRAGERAAAVGAPARAGLAVARQALGRHELARRRPGALRPAVRGPRPGRRRLDPRRGDRPRRARGRRRARRPPAPDRRRRRPPGRGRRRHLGDRVRRAAAATCRTSASTTFGASRLPVVTPVVGEHDACPGIFVAGTLGQAAKGLQRHGLPANSGAVHGARYNARVLARLHRADAVRRRAGAAGDRAGRGGLARLATELAEAPTLFHQRGYLARVLTADPAGGFRDDGRPAAGARPRLGRAGRAWRSPSRRTAAARSTRSSSRAQRRVDRPSTGSIPDPLAPARRRRRRAPR